MLEGMDRRRDRHAWTETATTNIIDPDGQLSFRYMKCLGHLHCQNILCPHLEQFGDYNENYWEGSSPDVLIPGSISEVPQKCSVLYPICKSTRTCLKLCPCKMYYITSKNPQMSRACVHFGTHEHHVATGDCREAMDIIREKVRDEVARTPHAKANAISLAVGRELLLKGLVDESREGNKLGEEEFAQILEKWSTLSTPSVNNMIKDAIVFCGQGGYIDNILKLKKTSTYDYIHDSRFPGQRSSDDIVYLFKMSTVGAGSGVDLVRHMQPGGNFELAWIIFNHVKRVVGWTSLGTHVYDPVFCKVMTIYVYDMMCEMADAQKQMWLSMIDLLNRHGVKNVNFKGFMADSAQANFNVVRKMFGSRDSSIPMEEKERTYQFHWSMVLDRHTRQLIKPELQARHIELCNDYRKCRNKADADLAMALIKAWWFSSGACSECALKELLSWLDFWHFCYDQWGSHISEVWATNLTYYSEFFSI